MTSTFATGQGLVHRQLARATTIVGGSLGTLVATVFFFAARRHFGTRARGRRATFLGGRRCCGCCGCGFCFRGALGVGGCFFFAALFVFFTLLDGFFTLTLSTLFGLGLIAAALTLFGALLLLAGAALGLIRFAGFGCLQRL